MYKGVSRSSCGAALREERLLNLSGDPSESQINFGVSPKFHLVTLLKKYRFFKTEKEERINLAHKNHIKQAEKNISISRYTF